MASRASIKFSKQHPDQHQSLLQAVHTAMEAKPCGPGGASGDRGYRAAGLVSCGPRLVMRRPAPGAAAVQLKTNVARHKSV